MAPSYTNPNATIWEVTVTPWGTGERPYTYIMVAPHSNAKPTNNGER